MGKTDHLYSAESILLTNDFIGERLASPSFSNLLSEILMSGYYITNLTKIDLEILVDLFKIIDLITPTKTSLQIEVIRGVVYSLLNYIGSLYVRDGNVSTIWRDIHLLFRKAVIEHAATKRTINFYADLLHVHPKYLGHIVKTRTGYTAGEWIQKQVILEAKILLQNPKFSIGEISDSLDFPNQNTFGKYFKKYAGISPKAYRVHFEKYL